MSDKDGAEDWAPAASDWNWDQDVTPGSECDGVWTENQQGGSEDLDWIPKDYIRYIESDFTASLSEGALHELRKVLEMCRVKYQLQDVLLSTGVRLRRGDRGCAVANCPFPMHPLRSPTLIVDLAGPNRFWCEACGVSGDVLEYIGALRGVSFLAGQFELLTGRSLRTQVASEYADEVESVARISRREEINGLITVGDTASSVYRALLERLSLYETHRTYLLNCGLTIETCNLNEYRSLPPSVEERVTVAESLVADGYEIGATPGFFCLPDDGPDPNLRGRWCFGGDRWGRRAVSGGIGPEHTSYQVEGLIVPVRDRNSQVVQLAVENAYPPLSASSSVKNTWPPPTSILTPYRGVGVVGDELSGGARLHHTGVVGDAKNQYPDGLWITEGALVADVISSELQSRAVGVPSCGQLVDEVLREAQLYGRLYVVPDRHGSGQVEKICREAETLGLETYIASWDFSNMRNFSNFLRTEEGGLEWVASFESWLYGIV